MKPSPFGYSRPASVDEALSTLAAHGSDAKVLAGGQSLLPILSMRLAAPHHLVDINRLTELDYVRLDASTVRVGALARHARVLADTAARVAQPLLAQALRLVAHATIRNRGTTVGSIVHADPSGEMTAVLALLGGSVRVASKSAHRDVPADEFFLGPLESAVAPGELALEASFPVLGPRSGTAFVEVSRRQGDYAVCGVGALVELDGEGVVSSARTAYLSVSATPLVLDVSEAGEDFAAAAALAHEQVDPEADIHATADYRRHLAGVLTERALRAAHAAAVERSAHG
ncbi:MAG: aerobic carbon-monoxide dehydrogenase medium subunit [Pseudonocardiales bacterium]|nr:aerobic carbon-monoxide dehydrogenase medium subunit [Pseudonocardiales bacterium]